jgi:hypothetical protein
MIGMVNSKLSARQASFLRLRDGASDSNSEANLLARLCLVFAHQDRNQIARRPEVKAGIMFCDVRKGQVLNDSFLVHPEIPATRSDRLHSGNMEACNRQ